ncbi:AfsR/SARP family transcriptional regulator, partial [Ideonella azotifigens]
MKATHCLLRLLGQPRLSWLGEPARDIRFRYRKTWLLLACLACHPAEWQPRSVLAGRLWPALPAAAALTNLRQLLADASQGLGSLALGLALEVERQQVRLRPHAQLLVDLHLLREWQQQAPADAELSLAALGDAQIWLSPLLEGFSTDALTSGDDWLGPERQRWRQTGLASVRTLSRWLQAQGRTAAAISAARAAWQQEPLDEDLAAGLIDLLVAHADLRGAREVLTLTDNHWR